MNKTLVKIVNIMVEAKYGEFLKSINTDEARLVKLSIEEDFKLTKLTTSLEVLQKIDKLTISEIEALIAKDITEFYNSYLADYAVLDALSAEINEDIKRNKHTTVINVCVGGGLYGIQLG